VEIQRYPAGDKESSCPVVGIDRTLGSHHPSPAVE
jgi:hypothetical protein